MVIWQWAGVSSHRARTCPGLIAHGASNAWMMYQSGQSRVFTSALEAYPLDADLTPSTSSTGYVSTFKKAGFKIVARHVPPRPIMRYEFK
jgi:hypothetical protein